MTGEIFRAYIEQFLAPTLASGDIVLMDNVRLHKVAGIKDAIEAQGATLRYLPAYSPDLNPIEQFFAKLKSILRKVGASTVTSLWKAIAAAFKAVLPQECAAFLANSGYGQLKRKTL
jgi:transposase